MISPVGGRHTRMSAQLVNVLIATTGTALALPGAWLLSNGGSAYYLIAGLTLVGSAFLAYRQQPSALWVYSGLLVATTGWSLYEAGFDFWALLPRLAYLSALGLCLLLTFPRSSVDARRSRLILMLSVTTAVLTVIAPLLTRTGVTGAGIAPSRYSMAGPADWPSYGNSHSDHFGPVGEITPENVGRLTRAWVYRTGLLGPDGKRKAGLELTPLMVDGVLYGCTSFDSIFAVEPDTGKQLWRRDTLARPVAGGHPVCRGLAFYRAASGAADCPTRILVATIDNYLVALNARTGEPCAGFGDGGRVDLLPGLGQFPPGWIHPTSPPTVVNGTAVVGAFVIDNQSTNVPPGVIRGYDATTGILKWAFDPSRPDNPTPLPPDSVYTPSTPNAWTVFSGDEALNLIFVPMGNGSPDFYGGSRSVTTERFSSALVALDASNGTVRWVFQAVHHDLWDYDLASQPALVDFPLHGIRVPALILPTKTGQLFVLDRRSGQPLTRVEERKAPISTLPGERSSPTQPYSVDMPDLSGKPLVEADMWGLTPFDQLYCRIAFKTSRYDGLYTPMGLRPSIRYPGELGGIDWGGVSIDEKRSLLIVNVNYMADRDQFITREQADREKLFPKTDPRGHFAPGGAMAGTPYGVHWGPFLTALGIPCQQPPFGSLSAIDLRSRKTIWSRPLGDARNSGPFNLALGLPIQLGAPNIGGTLVTGTGIIFVGATQDEMFRAFDVHSRKLLWQTKLPAGGHATPMTYQAGDGHQYVVIAAGGGALQDELGDFLVAFRLSSTAPQAAALAIRREPALPSCQPLPAPLQRHCRTPTD